MDEPTDVMLESQMTDSFSRQSSHAVSRFWRRFPSIPWIISAPLHTELEADKRFESFLLGKKGVLSYEKM